MFVLFETKHNLSNWLPNFMTPWSELFVWTNPKIQTWQIPSLSIILVPNLKQEVLRREPWWSLCEPRAVYVTFPAPPFHSLHHVSCPAIPPRCFTLRRIKIKLPKRSVRRWACVVFREKQVSEVHLVMGLDVISHSFLEKSKIHRCRSISDGGLSSD